MNNYSKPTIADKLTKAGIIIGIGVAALMFIGLLLSNITHLDAWILISGIVGSGLIGAFVGGILWVIGFVLGGTMDAKDGSSAIIRFALASYTAVLLPVILYYIYRT